MKYAAIFLMLIFLGCDDYNGYDSKQDENWAITLKHAYNQGYVDGGIAAANLIINQGIGFNDRRYADSCKYAAFVDKIIKP